MTKRVNINIVVYCVFIPTLLCLQLTSCGLFDKELKQDQHLEQFRHQLSRVQDSLSIPVSRIRAFNEIINNIKEDEDLITPRKKNLLLIDANNYLSNEYVYIKNYTKALEYSNISISLDSMEARGYFNRGGIYHTMGKDSLAVLDYTRAIDLNSNLGEAYYNRGIIYERSKRYEEALNDYNKAIKQEPPYLADIYNNRGNVYLALSDSAKALDDYSKVIDLNAENVNAYSNRANLYIKQNELDKALEDCNKALDIDSSFIRTYFQRASIYEQKKEYKNAFEDYEKVLQLDHGDEYNVTDALKRLRKLVKNK